MNFFKLYIGDYQRDTAHLSIAEHGAYLLMLQHYYATEKPLPVGRALHRMLRAQSKEERDAIDVVSDQFWSTTDAGLVNARADDEITKANTQADTNARIAREREERRRATRQEHEQSTNRATNGQPNQTPDTRHQKEDRNTARRSAPTCPKPSDVDEQTWADWTALRKGKKAAVSLTVVDGARHEAEKAGMSLEAFLRVWCVRGSQGLQADWLKPHEISGRQMESTIARENRERVAAFTGGKASVRPLITIEAEHGQTPFALG